MLPNTGCEFLLCYLLSAIKSPSFLSQNLSFCQIDVWDNVLLLNCPGQKVFEDILKSKVALANAIYKQLPEVKFIHLQWLQKVAELKVDCLIGRQTDHFFKGSPLAFDIANLIKQSTKPVLVTKQNGQIVFAYSPQTNEQFNIKSIYLNGTEANYLTQAVNSHGWVNGYLLKIDSYDSKSVFTTVRARYVENSLLNELMLIIQVLNTETIAAVPSQDLV